MENERDEDKEEAQAAWLGAVAASEAKAREDDELARVQDSLAAMEEARLKSKVEGTSLFLEIGATKDKVSSLKS